MVGAKGNTLLASGAAPAQSALFLGFILASFQIIDGVFTSIGIQRFGLEVEGNFFMRSMMEQFGHVTTLAVLKTFAVFLVIFLTLTTRKIPWVKNAMGAITCFYLLAAIIPWVYILFLTPEIP